jgi:aminoglycoside phosphotransferase family enzyme
MGLASKLRLAEKVAFLSDGRNYAPAAGRVHVLETHMSWVFLTDRHAYKLKKPVRFDSLDFTTLEARRRFCAEEVRLNRQLAEGVYLDTLPLVVTSSGELVIGGEGEVVDWLVLMRRLPLAARLDTLIPEHRVDRDRLVAAVRLVSAFYAAEAPLELGAHTARVCSGRSSAIGSCSRCPAAASRRTRSRASSAASSTSSPVSTARSRREPDG